MARKNFLLSNLLFNFALFLILAISMADAEMNSVPKPSSSESSVHIIYTENPEGEEPESYHLRTLASVFGSEDAATESLLYSFKDAVSGFSAKLTPEQVSQISKQPGVLQVVLSKVAQLHAGHGMLRI